MGFSPVSFCFLCWKKKKGQSGISFIQLESGNHMMHCHLLYLLTEHFLTTTVHSTQSDVVTHTCCGTQNIQIGGKHFCKPLIRSHVYTSYVGCHIERHQTEHKATWGLFCLLNYFVVCINVHCQHLFWQTSWSLTLSVITNLMAPTPSPA